MQTEGKLYGLYTEEENCIRDVGVWCVAAIENENSSCETSGMDDGAVFFTKKRQSVEWVSFLPIYNNYRTFPPIWR